MSLIVYDTYHKDPHVCGLVLDNQPCKGFFSDKLDICKACPVKGSCQQYTWKRADALAWNLANPQPSVNMAPKTKMYIKAPKGSLYAIKYVPLDHKDVPTECTFCSKKLVSSEDVLFLREDQVEIALRCGSPDDIKFGFYHPQCIEWEQCEPPQQEDTESS